MPVAWSAFSIGESGKNLGLRGGSGEWVMEAAVENGGADLEHAVCAAR